MKYAHRLMPPTVWAMTAGGGQAESGFKNQVTDDLLMVDLLMVYLLMVDLMG